MADPGQDEDDVMLAVLTNSRLGGDIGKPSAPPVTMATPKAKAGMQPGKRFQPQEPKEKRPRANPKGEKKAVAVAGGGVANPSTPAATRMPSVNPRKAAAAEENIQEKLDTCDIVNVLTGKSGRMDLYQCKRAVTSLEKKGFLEESAQLNAKLQIATSAQTLLPVEAAKLGLDQIQAGRILLM